MAMNQQTKMSNYTNAPTSLRNMLFLYGNRNGDLKFRMEIELDFGPGLYPWLELSVIENAVGIGGPNGVVEVYRFEKTNFSSTNKLHLFFDNFFGPVNLGLRAESTLSASSIFEMRCNILNADIV
ncbi:hypothetical protein D9V86_09225 [Bacteroidetes/Chlorobi group bacterium ChocPot_Mid]|nr:MAG: hypothetical protein D9V86_09225 [Bacteroidetes/Chlorobi group bacterium ChocPot_Mid]